MLFDLYCITPILVKDYYDYNGSYEGISDFIFNLYAGIYSLYVFEDCYGVLHKQGDVLILMFVANKGNKTTLYRLVKQINDFKNKFNVKKIIFKTKNYKNYEFLNKLASEKYVIYVL